jgi:hypothetical protein
MLGLLIATATAVLIAPATAFAEPPYPDEPPAASVSDGTVSDGGTVTFSGEGFIPGETIAIEISYDGSDSTAGFSRAGAGGFVLAAAAILPRKAGLEVTASDAGSFSVEIPLTQVGTATLVATGLTSGVTVTSVVEVVAADDSDSGDSGDDGNDSSANAGNALPTTGTSGRMMAFSVYGGLGAVLLGAALIWFTSARRRRSTE